MLKAGFSRVDVTPPLGSYISGYFHARYAKGVLDPIELNALAFSDGENTALIVISDFIGVGRNFCDELREKISARTGISADHIMLTALHQHTSVCIADKEPNTRGDRAYMDMVYRKYCDVAQMSLDDMKEAELGYGEEETAEQIAFVRRYVMKDGSIATNPDGRGAEILRPCDAPDNTVRLLRFKRKDANDIAFVNFCTHPDVIGGEMLSADWPGFARRYVEKELDGVSCLLLNGVQGDSNHCDFINGVRGGYGHSAHMGRVIADTVRKLWDHTEAVADGYVNGAIDVVYNKTRTDGEEEYDACVKLLEDNRAGKVKAHITELGRATRIVNLRKDVPIYRQVPITVLKLGEVAFVGFGGEPFTHYAKAIREAFPDKTVLSACCCNGYEGYLPTAQAFAEGGYEASSSAFSPNLEEQCFKLATKLIKQL